MPGLVCQAAGWLRGRTPTLELFHDASGSGGSELRGRCGGGGVEGPGVTAAPGDVLAAAPACLRDVLVWAGPARGS